MKINFLKLMAVLSIVVFFGQGTFLLAAPNDGDNDGILDVVDWDNDNDGIFDRDEKYCDESTQIIIGSGQYKKSLHFFDWSGLNIANNDLSGNTLHTAQFTHKGIIYKAEIQNVNRTGPDAITAIGMGGGYAPSFSIPVYNPAGNTEVIKTYFPNEDSVTYDIKFSAERNGESYPVKIAVFDAQVTNHNFRGWKEGLTFTTNGTNFTHLEEIGGNPNSSAITGENTQTLTYLNTRPDDVSIPTRNAMFYTRGIDLRISTKAELKKKAGPFATQAMAYAVVLNCDTDNDGTPNYLDLDSDNDGCFDSLEGGANFLTESDLNTDGSVNGGVNAHGIPITISFGQTVGSSTQATKLGLTTPLTNQTYQVNDTINLNITDAYYQTTQTFNAGTPDYSGAPQQTTGINYQWQVSTDNGTTFNDIAGETNANLSLTATAAMDGNIYRVMANCTERVCLQELSRAKITLVNLAPTTNNDSATTNINTAVDIDIKANDTDSDGNIDPTTVTITTQPQHGSVSINATTGVVTYTPDTGYTGNDSFEYTVDDDDGATSNSATASISVHADTDGDGIPDITDPDDDNDGNLDTSDTHPLTPTAADDTTSAQVGIAKTINILANDDFLPGNNTSLTDLGTGTAQGTVSLNPTTGELSYTSIQAEVGSTVSINYEVCNTNPNPNVCETATVNISVTSNDFPTITTHNTAIHTGETLNLLDFVDSASDTEDTDLDKDDVTVANDGGFDPNTEGTYTITYSVTDSDNNTTTETATVTVTNNPITTTPDTGSAPVTGGEVIANVLVNDTLGGNPVALADVNLTQESTTNAGVTLDPATGAVSVAAGTPAGDYTLTYKICEKTNPTNCSTAIVTVTVNSNDTPTITTHNDTITKGDTFNLLDLVDSASDSEDTGLNKDDVTVSNDGGFDANVPGTYTITFSVTDSDGNTTTKTATVKVKEKKKKTGSKIVYVCKDKQASNYSPFGKHKRSLCRYTNTATPNLPKPQKEDEPLCKEHLQAQCPIFTQHMVLGDRDGYRGKEKQNKGISQTIYQVRLLQIHLKKQGFYYGTPNGVFDKATDQAVKAWQTKHFNNVLKPWGMTKASGRFYQSSERWMNIILGCNDSVTLDNGTYLGRVTDSLVLDYAKNECSEEETTKPLPPVAPSCPIFTQHMRKGDRDGQRGQEKQNTGVSSIINEVKLLQRHLNTLGFNAATNIDGIFGTQTENAVKAFQMKYFNQILKPWGMTKASGRFYQSSERWMNEVLGCHDMVTLDNGTYLDEQKTL